MHKVWKALGLRQLIVERLSSLQQELAMIRSRVVPGKHSMVAFMLAIKEVKMKSESIPLHMHHVHTETKHLKYNNETPTVMVHAGHINKTTTLPIPTE